MVTCICYTDEINIFDSQAFVSSLPSDNKDKLVIDHYQKENVQKNTRTCS